MPETHTPQQAGQSAEDDRLVVVYSTFPTAEAAREVGRALVEARLAACVNVVAGMVALYEWEGRLCEDAEAILLAKTRAGLAGQAMEAVRARHPYTTPALFVLPTAGGSEAYLGWIVAQTAPPERA